MDSFGWFSLLPPLLAIGLALWTRQVFISLAAGLWLGFVIMAGWNPIVGTFDTIDGIVRVFDSPGNTRIVLLTLVIGALIALIQRSGGVAGFVRRLIAMLERLSDQAGRKGQRKLVELLALVTALLLFVESNISILTVGTVYRPVFDKLGIPREKLAYITDSGSAPSCILLPINAWGAYLIGLIAAQGLTNPVGQLVNATLYNFYPMIVIIMLVFVIMSGRDIGEMKRAELRAKETGKLTRDDAQLMMGDETTSIPAKEGAPLRARNMLIPIAAMVLLMIVFLIMTGEGDTILARMFSGSGSKAVIYAASIAVLLAMVLYKAQGVMGIRESFEQALKGISGMVSLAILMVLALALGALCKDLGTGQFVAETAKGFISPALVPALIFLIACFVSFSTGTSWGTFAVMLPIAVPLATGMDTNVSLAIAAAIGGGVFGDHCSPTSDTSIITSMATANDHIDHIRTQLPYALIAGGLTTLLYLILGAVGA